MRAPQPELFDAFWPANGQRAAEAVAPVTQQPVAPAMAQPTAPAIELRAAAEPASGATGPAEILKSGVVDGMAYTLYADGSIEAQLPDGTVRFGSIAELRAHIDNHS